MSRAVTATVEDIVVMSRSEDKEGIICTHDDLLLVAQGIHDRTGALVVILAAGQTLEVLPEEDARLLYDTLKRRFDT